MKALHLNKHSDILTSFGGTHLSFYVRNDEYFRNRLDSLIQQAHSILAAKKLHFSKNYRPPLECF